MEVTTLFPSRRENNKTEGGVVLLEVERDSPDAQLALQASYENPGEGERTVTRTVGELDRPAPYYGTTGVRKAVVLAEYATLMQNWAAHERTDDGEAPAVTDPVERRTYDSQWEQSSVPLAVTAPYGERIARFLPYYRSHMDALGAERMERDLEILQALADRARASETGATATGDDAGATTGDRTTDDRATAGETTGPRATDVRSADAGTSAGFLGSPGSVVGLVNLGLTLLVGAYGIGQKRRSRNRVDDR
jgi:Ca-activated chloride channel family protein